MELVENTSVPNIIEIMSSSSMAVKCDISQLDDNSYTTYCLIKDVSELINGVNEFDSWFLISIH
jgi:hypothetical protein